MADVADCVLVKAATDEEFEKMLREWADKPHHRDRGDLDHRHLVCKRLLEEWLAPKDAPR
jgi:hypothetical protein